MMTDHFYLIPPSTQYAEGKAPPSITMQLLELPSRVIKEMEKTHTLSSYQINQLLRDFKHMVFTNALVPDLSDKDRLQLIIYGLTLHIKILKKNIIKARILKWTGYKKGHLKLYNILNNIKHNLQLLEPKLNSRDLKSLYQNHEKAIETQKDCIIRNEKLIELSDAILRDLKHDLSPQNTINNRILDNAINKLERIIQLASLYRDILNDEWLTTENIHHLVSLHPLLITIEGLTHLKHVNPKKINKEHISQVNLFIITNNASAECLERLFIVFKKRFPLKDLILINALHPLFFIDNHFDLINNEPRLSQSFIDNINKIMNKHGASIISTLFYLQDSFFLTELPLDALFSLPVFFLNSPKTITLFKSLKPFDSESIQHLKCAWNDFLNSLGTPEFNLKGMNSLKNSFLDQALSMHENGLNINKIDCYFKLGPSFYNTLLGRQFLRTHDEFLNNDTVTKLHIYLEKKGSLYALESALHDVGFNLNTLRGLPYFALSPNILIPLIQDKAWLGVEGRRLLYQLKPLFDEGTGLEFVLNNHPKKFQKHQSLSPLLASLPSKKQYTNLTNAKKSKNDQCNLIFFAQEKSEKKTIRIPSLLAGSRSVLMRKIEPLGPRPPSTPPTKEKSIKTKNFFAHH